MRRRFGRRRSRGGDARPAPLDAARLLDAVKQGGWFEIEDLEPLPDVATGLAAVARGTDGAGTAWLISASPRSGGDALLGALAGAAATPDFAGTALAVAPGWDAAARGRLGLVGERPYRVRAEILPGLGDGSAAVQPTALGGPAVLRVEQVAAQLGRPSDRDLFLRAAASLDGLAAKHGGAVRARGGAVELVVLARTAAVLAVRDGSVQLEPEAGRGATRVTSESLSDLLDRLEGFLRKRLSDKRVREGEEGLRARLLPLLADAGHLRHVRPWPLAGGDPAPLDLVGVAADGTAAAGAIRERLGLAELAPVLDALLTLPAALPLLLEGASAPLRFDSPRLLLAAETLAPDALGALSQLSLDVALFDVAGSRDGRTLRAREGFAPAPARAAAPRSSAAPRRDAAPAASAAAAAGSPAEAGDEGEAESRGTADAGRDAARGDANGGAGDRNRRRRRGRRGRRGEGGSSGERADAADGPASGAGAASDAGEPAARRFEELSTFDLDDDNLDSDDDGRRRRRGRRRGRGGRRGGEAGESSGGEAGGDKAERPRSDSDPGERSRRRAAEPSGDADDSDDLEDGLPQVSDEDVPDVDEADFAGGEVDEADLPLAARLRRERERRRRERRAEPEPEAENETEEEEQTVMPRKRAVFVAHADRDSLAAAVLLARDLRLVEGLWVYQQSELMTFFRGVATDLREDTPIYLFGFTASPARDVIQAASLYRGRLMWIDHHDWPPEDLAGLQEAVGEDVVCVSPGAGSSLPATAALCTRRSRFSDKLLDLVTGRFTQHDFQRWGRLWWHRLGELSAESGDRRAAVESLLQGRPSDLAKAAARQPVPEPPAEVAHVAGRDFRIVHFGGYALVQVPVPAGLDVYMTARVARERYRAQLSLAYPEDGELVVLAGDDGNGRRTLDLLGMADHMSGKFEWLDTLPDADHVARLRVEALPRHPERLDELIAEIAMGRSILEG